MAILYEGSGPGGSIQDGVDQWTPAKAELVRQDLNNLDVRIADTEDALADMSGAATGVGVLRFATLTLTDAQIKALPTTPINLVAAPGAGLYISVLAIELQSKFSAGAYTNIDATYSALAAAVNGSAAAGAAPTGALVDDSAPTPALTNLTAFMGAVNKRARLQPYLEAGPVAASAGYVVPSVDGAYNIDAFGDLENLALTLSADNNGSGDFTGGNSANTLRVYVWYFILPVP